MDCAARGTINEEMEEDTQVKRLLTIAKENMAQDFKRRFEEKLNQKNEELKRDYEENYKAQIEENKTKILLQDTAIENQKKELIEIKDSIKEKEETIDKLIEESKTKEAKIESLIEGNNLNCKRLFEFYKDKTDLCFLNKNYEKISLIIITK